MALPTVVNTFGFRQGVSTDDLTGIIRQVIATAAEWKRELYVGGQDVRTAFDSMSHGSVEAALSGRGLNAHMIGNLMREISGFGAKTTLPNAASCPWFSFSKGGKQGGVETPDVFNMLIEAACPLLG